jgi:uncharacterized protein YjbI with pentapeptide repeats
MGEKQQQPQVIAAGPGGDFRGARLEGANLSRLNLQAGDFRGAQLQGACLAESDLTGGDFRGADLSGVNAQRANFYGAKFQGALLEGADFRGCDMRQVNLEGAYLTGARLPEPAAETAALAERLECLEKAVEAQARQAEKDQGREPER